MVHRRRVIYENKIKFFGKTYQKEVPKNVAAESDVDETIVRNDKKFRTLQKDSIDSDYFTD